MKSQCCYSHATHPDLTTHSRIQAHSLRTLEPADFIHMQPYTGSLCYNPKASSACGAICAWSWGHQSGDLALALGSLWRLFWSSMCRTSPIKRPTDDNSLVAESRWVRRGDCTMALKQTIQSIRRLRPTQPQAWVYGETTAEATSRPQHKGPLNLRHLLLHFFGVIMVMTVLQ